MTRHDGSCVDCGEPIFRGQIIRVENGQPLCLECADLGHLVFLSRGNTALTRRATKHSPLHVVVVQWARARKRYERQGILVTPSALDRAEQECLADAGVRERRRERAAEAREATDREYVTTVAATLRQQYPGCSVEELERIAAWTCKKYSGRVGRSAAAKQLDPSAIRLAVVAHIRHEHTKYDQLLMETGDRQQARQWVRADIDRVLAKWMETPRRRLMEKAE